MDIVVEMSRLNAELPEAMFDVNFRDSSQDDNDNNLGVIEGILKRLALEIKGDLESGTRCVERCKWLIMTPSCLLMTLLSWDVVGDQNGWDGSYWIPLLGCGIMLTVCLVDNCVFRASSYVSLRAVNIT